MPRMARVVVPGLPHHVTQRGNRRQRTFFAESDYLVYLALLRECAPAAGLNVWSYCLMPNHVHLIAVPEHASALAACMGEVHRRYTRRINGRQEWTGYLWQGRFYSVVMDGEHAIAAARYVLSNPVRAGLCARPEQWPYSSARAHLRAAYDGLVADEAYEGLIRDWAALLRTHEDADQLERLRLHTRTGRPVGSSEFIDALERHTGRRLLPKRGGRPRKAAG